MRQCWVQFSKEFKRITACQTTCPSCGATSLLWLKLSFDLLGMSRVGGMLFFNPPSGSLNVQIGSIGRQVKLGRMLVLLTSFTHSSLVALGISVDGPAKYEFVAKWIYDLTRIAVTDDGYLHRQPRPRCRSLRFSLFCWIPDHSRNSFSTSSSRRRAIKSCRCHVCPRWILGCPTPVRGDGCGSTLRASWPVPFC